MFPGLVSNLLRGFGRFLLRLWVRTLGQTHWYHAGEEHEQDEGNRVRQDGKRSESCCHMISGQMRAWAQNRSLLRMREVGQNVSEQKNDEERSGELARLISGGKA